MRKRKAPRYWTLEEEEVIRNKYPTTPTSELATRFNCHKDMVRGKATRMGIYKDTSMHGRRVWTAAEIKKLREIFPDMKTSDVAKAMKRTEGSINSQANLLGLNKSEEYASFRKQLNGELLKINGRSTRFKKGNVSHNKGKKLSPELYKRLKPTMFKQGHNGHNKKPIGYERITKDGYREVKVEQPRRFELVHRFMWRVWKGPIPEDHIITFKDGDPKNCNIENLICLSMADHMRSNSVHRYPEEMVKTMWQIGRLKSKINKITNQ